MLRTRAQRQETRDSVGVGGEAEKGKKSHKSCRRDAENRRGLDEKRKGRRQESTGSLHIDPDDVEESRNEAKRGKCKALR